MIFWVWLDRLCYLCCCFLGYDGSFSFHYQHVWIPTSVGQTDRKEPHLAKTASNKTWTNLLTYFLSNQKYGFPACSVGLPECISYIYICILIYICISIHASIIKALNLRQVYTRILAWLKRCTVGKGGPPILILYSRTPHEAWNFRKPQDFSFTKLVEDDALI